VSLEGDLLVIVGRIYDAAADPSLWPAILQAILPLGDFHAATIHFQDLQSHAVGWVSSLNLSPEYEATYQQYYGSVNPWLRRREFLAKGRLNTRAMVMTDREMADTEFWQDWARHLGLFDFAAGVLAESPTTTGALTLFRPRGAEPCGERELEMLRLLTPHMIRATDLHRHIAQLERRSETLARVLDHLSMGVVVVDARGRIQMANRAGEGMAAAGDGLSVRAGVLTASSEHPRLVEAIAAACALAAGTGLQPPKRLAIARPSGKPSYSVLVCPSRPQLFHGFERPAAALFIVDPEAQLPSVRDLLISVYGLTAAEADLAETLAHGCSLAAAAEAHRVSRNTVKTQLQQIFSKTDTHRQADLVRLIASMTGPVAPDIR